MPFRKLTLTLFFFFQFRLHSHTQPSGSDSKETLIELIFELEVGLMVETFWEPFNFYLLFLNHHVFGRFRSLPLHIILHFNFSFALSLSIRVRVEREHFMSGILLHECLFFLLPLLSHRKSGLRDTEQIFDFYLGKIVYFRKYLLEMVFNLPFTSRFH